MNEYQPGWLYISKINGKHYRYINMMICYDLNHSRNRQISNWLYINKLTNSVEIR